MMLREDAVRISLFGTEMYPFGLCCAVGAVCALIAAGVICRMRKSRPGTAPLLGLLCLVLGIICSRLAFCLMDQELGTMMPFGAWFLADRGGWSLFGAIGGVMLGAWLTARIAGEKPARMLDAASVSMCLFIAAERLAEDRIDGFNISRTLPEGIQADGFFIARCFRTSPSSPSTHSTRSTRLSVPFPSARSARLFFPSPSPRLCASA